MSSEIDICNLALSNIRAGAISSLTESSLQAQQCALKYPLIRNRMLKEHWGFNNKIQALAVLSTDVFNWAYAYQYPKDCLKIVRLLPAYEEVSAGNSDVISRMRESQLLPSSQYTPTIPYEVFNFSDNKVIAANESDLRIKYAVKITDPNLFSEDFILALGHLLGAELAIPLVGAETGRQLRNDELQLYEEYVNAASADDMNESGHEQPLSEYETIRR